MRGARTTQYELEGADGDHGTGGSSLLSVSKRSLVSRPAYTTLLHACPGEPQQDSTEDTHLLETHILCILTEALAADVDAVFPDDAPLVPANTAAQQ